MNKNQKGFAHIGMLVLIAVLLVIAISGWYVWSKDKVIDSDAQLESATSTVKNNETKADETVVETVSTDTFVFKELGISMDLEEGWTAAVQPNNDSQEDPNIQPLYYAVTKPGITAYINAYRTSMAVGFAGCQADAEMEDTAVLDIANTGIEDVLVYNNSKTGLGLVSKNLKYGSKTKSLATPQLAISTHAVGDIYYYCASGTAPLSWSADFDNNTGTIDAVIATDKATTNTMAVPKSTPGYDEIVTMLKSVKKI